MDLKLYTLLNRWRMGVRCRVRIHDRSEEAMNTTGKAPGRRFYYHSERAKRSLYARISPLGSPDVNVKPELDGWVSQHNKVCVAELKRIIFDLRKRRRFSQALEVSEWMNEKGICKFSPAEHAVQLDLIGRTHGFPEAEIYFSNLPEEHKIDKTYGALLNCYVRQRQTEKALLHFQKMKEMGCASSSLNYNDIMCLYINTGQHNKVFEVLSEMKESNVKPDNYSYRICISSFGGRSDIEGMEKLLKEMETQPHIAVDWNTYALAANYYVKEGFADKAVDSLKNAEVRLEKKDGTGFNSLISLYAKLGKRDEVLRLWELEKITCKRCINRDFMTVLESLVRLGEIDEAKKTLEEWEASGNCYDFRVPNIVIMGLCEKELFEEAGAMLEALAEKGKPTKSNSWGLVAAGYLDNDKMREAFECMKVALSLRDGSKGWKPNKRVVMGLLSWVGEQGSVSEAEFFVESLRPVIHIDRLVYHALLRAYIRGGKDLEAVLDKMRADKVDEDGETRKILSKRQDKS